MKILRAKIKKAVNNLLGPVSKTWRQMPEKSTHSSSSPGRLDAVIEELYFSEPEEISKTIKERKQAVSEASSQVPDSGELDLADEDSSISTIEEDQLEDDDEGKLTISIEWLSAKCFVEDEEAEPMVLPFSIPSDGANSTVKVSDT